jgi:hypothetical protein
MRSGFAVVFQDVFLSVYFRVPTYRIWVQGACFGRCVHPWVLPLFSSFITLECEDVHSAMTVILLPDSTSQLWSA